MMLPLDISGEVLPLDEDEDATLNHDGDDLPDPVRTQQETSDKEGGEFFSEHEAEGAVKTIVRGNPE